MRRGGPGRGKGPTHERATLDVEVEANVAEQGAEVEANTSEQDAEIDEHECFNGCSAGAALLRLPSALLQCMLCYVFYHFFLCPPSRTIHYAASSRVCAPLMA
ncbi:unnamed protein product [Prorocentrum cordatum]|uniref:Uncharacterized protein n=1 Tax=Prorocentrum cordatum TaxID=2364126 RepID=A0ABN9XP70_9DINO|nr:unnamed protein product [Polarella glacialis]